MSNDKKPTVDEQIATNRAGRRKAQALARKQRHLFQRYQAHMKAQGYDVTFDDFVKSIPYRIPED